MSYRAYIYKSVDRNNFILTVKQNYNNITEICYLNVKIANDVLAIDEVVVGSTANGKYFIANTCSMNNIQKKILKKDYDSAPVK